METEQRVVTAKEMATRRCNKQLRAAWDLANSYDEAQALTCVMMLEAARDANEYPDDAMVEVLSMVEGLGEIIYLDPGVEFQLIYDEDDDGL